jgi:hypothetical protein
VSSRLPLEERAVGFKQQVSRLKYAEEENPLVECAVRRNCGVVGTFICGQMKVLACGVAACVDAVIFLQFPLQFGFHWGVGGMSLEM